MIGSCPSFGVRSAFLSAVLCAVVACGALASTASAGDEPFMGSQGLSATNAYASASAHSLIYEVRGNADHTHCPAVASGYSGYTSTPFTGGNGTYGQGICGPGYQRWQVYGSPYYGQFYHGAEYNPNSSTYDFFYYAYYYWF